VSPTNDEPVAACLGRPATAPDVSRVSERREQTGPALRVVCESARGQDARAAQSHPPAHGAAVGQRVRWTRRVEMQMRVCAHQLEAITGVPAPQILRMMEEGGRFDIGGRVKCVFLSPGLQRLPGRRWIESDSYEDFR
jgi:hypothetical protein